MLVEFCCVNLGFVSISEPINSCLLTTFIELSSIRSCHTATLLGSLTSICTIQILGPPPLKAIVLSWYFPPSPLLAYHQHTLPYILDSFCPLCHPTALNKNHATKWLVLGNILMSLRWLPDETFQKESIVTPINTLLELYWVSIL